MYEYVCISYIHISTYAFLMPQTNICIEMYVCMYIKTLGPFSISILRLILRITELLAFINKVRRSVLFFNYFIYVYIHTNICVYVCTYFNRCVTLASATANACNAENGYWKSNVYAFPSIRPNCITYNTMISNWINFICFIYNGNAIILKNYLFATKFNLEIFGWFLCNASTKI